LQPLLVAIYRTADVKAVLVAKKDSPYRSFADLKGKDVAIVKEGKEHIRRYARKEAGGEPASFFGKVITPSDSEAALDAVLLDKVQAALVDRASLDIYKEVNPGRFQRLKIVGESASFPPAVVAFNPKQIDGSTAARFKQGMLKANQTAKGRDVMANFKITAFELAPAHFEQSLASVRKQYPD